MEVQLPAGRNTLQPKYRGCVPGILGGVDASVRRQLKTTLFRIIGAFSALGVFYLPDDLRDPTVNSVQFRRNLKT